MLDLSETLKGKTEELTVDDMSGVGQLLIQVKTVVRKDDPNEKRPTRIFNDQGKPYYPCLLMRRAIAQAWGKDGKQYAGRWMGLYVDPDVHFGTEKTGGIRVFGFSHIDAPFSMYLTVAKGRRKLFHFKKLDIPTNAPTQAAAVQPVETVRTDLLELAEKAAKEGMAAYAAFFKDGCNAKERVTLQPYHEGYKAEAAAADSAKPAPTEAAADPEPPKPTGDGILLAIEAENTRAGLDRIWNENDLGLQEIKAVDPDRYNFIETKFLDKYDNLPPDAVAKTPPVEATQETLI